MSASQSTLETACAIALALAVGCAPRASAPAAPVRPSRSAGGEHTAGGTTAGSPAARVALDALRTRLGAGDASALATLGVALQAAGRSREITGEPSPDERVESARLVARDADSAALLVATTCGNATLGAVRWDGARWVPGEHVALVEPTAPGRCAQTNVRAEALALSTDAPREIAVVLVSQDATGESIRGPFLTVFQLQTGGRFGTLLADAPFGAMDDATGATTVGEYNVIPDVPPPRDIHVAIRPGRPGPGGPAPTEVVRRRYALHGAHYEMVDQTSEVAE